MISQSSAPQNCKYALTGNFNQFYPAPNYKAYALFKKQQKLRPVLTYCITWKWIQESVV